MNKDEMVSLARGAAQRIAHRHDHVVQVLLFGSFSRDDYGPRSDLDLLIILRSSDTPFRERIPDFLDDTPAYPTDVFPYTMEEVELRLAAGDPFMKRAVSEAIQLYPAP